ncbi:MAG TPA: hypothetical protein DCX54_09780, partial [Flavobacteriales bacterium]|nr:hypothetical protein [Flavobacteriales bacterium]
IAIGILAFGLYSNNNSARNIALVTFVLMAIIAIPVYLSGQEAEEIVEHLSGISEKLIEEHEELAETAIWLMGALGVLAIINLFVIKANMNIAKGLSIITLLLSLVTFGFFAWVGNTGGEIRHSEIRSGFSSSTGNNSKMGIEKKRNNGEREDHDDD